MKKILLIIIPLLLLLSSCSRMERYTVTFVDGDVTTETITTVTGYVDFPKPKGRENSEFDRWYLDRDLTEPVPSDYRPTAPVTLYAGYKPDYKAMINTLYSDHVHSNVTVVMSVGRYEKAQGSGVIIHEDGGFYYCLTNNHVINSEGASGISYSVVDCYGRSHTGNVIYAEPESDLALVGFFKGRSNLYVLPVSDTAPGVGDDVLAFGQPNGIVNALSVGQIVSVNDTEYADAEGVEYKYESIKHNAPLDHGCSGGALFNDSLELIGINFAITTTEDGDFVNGYAVSYDRLRAFLEYCNMLEK